MPNQQLAFCVPSLHASFGRTPPVTTSESTSPIDPAFDDLPFNEFDWLNIDDRPSVLSATYAMRYQSYCLEQKFLDPTEYPNGLESDKFDGQSIHLAVFHQGSERIGTTVRIVVPEDVRHGYQKLPMFDYCSVTESLGRALEDGYCGEISRLVMRRTGFLDGGIASSPSEERRRRQKQLAAAILTLYKGMYQTCRRQGITHLLAAMEKSLYRLVSRYHFPFRQIGPEVDYFGPVYPFILDLDELDQALFERAPRLLAEFFRGLEPWALPTESDLVADADEAIHVEAPVFGRHRAIAGVR